MASGSPDYWASKSNNLSALIAAVSTNLKTGSNLIDKIDALDGTVDGVLTLGDLNSGACNLLTQIIAVVTALGAGGVLAGKMDVLDGTMDGKLTLADLNSAGCDILAAILGIPAGSFDDTDLLAKLDALDGTMDGKLDLTQLNSSVVKTNLDTVITSLASVATKLDTTISNLIELISTLKTIPDLSTNEGSIILTSTCQTILAANANRTCVELWNGTGSYTMYIYLAAACGGTAITLTPNQRRVLYGQQIITGKITTAGAADLYYTERSHIP